MSERLAAHFKSPGSTAPNTRMSIKLWWLDAYVNPPAGTKWPPRSSVTMWSPFKHARDQLFIAQVLAARSGVSGPATSEMVAYPMVRTPNGTHCDSQRIDSRTDI